MNRYTFTDSIKLDQRLYGCKVCMANWSELCDFLPKPIFKCGRYLEENNQLIGVILNGPNGDIIVKDGEVIYWHEGIYEIIQNGEDIKIYE